MSEAWGSSERLKEARIRAGYKTAVLAWEAMNESSASSIGLRQYRRLEGEDVLPLEHAHIREITSFFCISSDDWICNRKDNNIAALLDKCPIDAIPIIEASVRGMVEEIERNGGVCTLCDPY